LGKLKQDIEKLYELREYANFLEQGIDPTSKIAFPEDTIMNMPRIKKYNRNIREILDFLIIQVGNDGKDEKRYKIPFFLSVDDKRKFEYPLEPISISQFCYSLNKNISQGMCKIQSKQLTRGLEILGYLETKDLDGEKTYKVPTEKGLSLGILVEERKNSYGNKYSVNLYSQEALQFLLNNLKDILQAI